MMDEQGTRDFRVRVWFHHNFVRRSSKYIIHNLPDDLKHELKESLERIVPDGEDQSQFILTDALITEMVANSWQNRIHHVFMKLLEYV